MSYPFFWVFWYNKKENTAWFINELVEKLGISEPYLFGRPREYSLSMMLKLVHFAYTRSVFSSRKIEQLAEKNFTCSMVNSRKPTNVSNNCSLQRFSLIKCLTEYGIENVPLVHCFLPLSAKKCTSKCDAVTISNNKSDNNDHKVN